MKKLLTLVLMLVFGLSLNGIVFAQDTVASDENLPLCAGENGSANATGVLISDFAGVLVSDFAGVLISDLTGVLVGDLYSDGSDTKGCKKE